MRAVVSADGRFSWAGGSLRCVLGRTGIRSAKREGDGATPAGRMALRRVFYRPDRVPPPATGLPVRPLHPSDGWCDDPGHRDYNRLVRLPHPAGHERMWREDHLYDLVVELGWNDMPPRPGLGSAIFLHLAAPDGSPTAGCVALAPEDLRAFLAGCGPGAWLEVLAP